MNLSSVLPMLLGAALVAVGVLAAALADRVRGLRVSREIAAHDRPQRAPRAPAAIPVVEAVTLPARPPRPVRPAPIPAASTEGGEDVIVALVAAGYKKPVATEATWACGAGERASIEGWTAAALRRCARGGMS